jgi:hypothetical protein
MSYNDEFRSQQDPRDALNELAWCVEQLKKLKQSKPPVTVINTGGAGGGLDNQFVVFDSSGTAATSYGSFADANAAIQAGDVMWLPAGTITDDCTLVAGAEYIGRGPKNTIFTGQVALADGATLANLSIPRTANDSSVLAAVVVPASGNADLVNVFASATQSGTGYGIGIMRNSGDTGEVTQYGGSVYGSSYNVANYVAGRGSLVTSGTVDGGTGGATATDVSGLTAGKWYEVETSGGPFYLESGLPANASYVLSANLSNSLDSGSQMGFEVWHSVGWVDLVPAWIDGASRVGSYYYKFHWKQTGTHLYLWAYDGNYADNAPGTLAWSLYNYNVADTASIDAWYHVSAVENGQLGEPLAGDRAAFDATNYASRHANDADSGATAIHHTLGIGADQAAAGNHTHASSGNVATDGIWDAKGDLAVGTGADTASKLSVGADATILTADSAEATGMKWAAPAAVSIWNQVINESGASFANFTGASGTWASDGTVIKQTNTAGAPHRAKYNTKIANSILVFEAEVQVRAAGVCLAGIVAGFDGANGNGSLFYAREDSDIVAFETDSSTTRLSIATTIAANTWYKLRIVMAGGMYTGYVDGVLKGTSISLNVNDSSYVGLWSYGCESWFRNIKAWTLNQP